MDDFHFGRGISNATVRCNQAGMGMRSPISDPTRPWSEGVLGTYIEFLKSAGDEFDIVVDCIKTLRTDPVDLDLLGDINRTAVFGYSASGYQIKGLLRLKMAKDCSTSRS